MGTIVRNEISEDEAVVAEAVRETILDGASIQPESTATGDDRPYKRLVEQFYDGVVISDAQGVIVEWNRAQAELTGVSSAEAVGRALWDLDYMRASARGRRVNNQRSRRDFLCRTLAEENDWAPQVAEYEIQAAGGRRVMVRSVASRLDGVDGPLFAFVIRDLSAPRRYETDRESLIMALREALASVN